MTKKKTPTKKPKAKKDDLSLIAEGKDKEQLLNAHNAASWLLSQPALKKDGTPVTYNGRPLNNMELQMVALMQAGQDNPTAAMTVLTLSGALQNRQEATEEQKRQYHNAYEKHRKKARMYYNSIKKNLEDSEVYAKSLNAMIKTVAQLMADCDECDEECAGQPISIHETSREGMDRQKFNPIRQQLKDMKAQASKQYDALLRRAYDIAGKSLGSDDTADDPYTTLMAQLANNHEDEEFNDDEFNV